MILGFLIFFTFITFITVILVFYGILLIPFLIVSFIIYFLCKLNILPKDWIDFDDKDKK